MMLSKQLHVLIYHRVLPTADQLRPGSLTLPHFENQLSILKKWFNVVSLAEGYNRLLEGSLPPRAVSITFDDGYQDNIDIALPALKSYQMPATFFIASSFLDGSIMFNDIIIESIRDYHGTLTFNHKDFECSTLPGKREAINYLTSLIKKQPISNRLKMLAQYLPNGLKMLTLMMDTHGPRLLAAQGMGIGAHTVHHPLLSCETEEDAYAEIANSKSELESLIQNPVTWFAYPNGKAGEDFSAKHKSMVREIGFSAALATDFGMINKDSDPYCLPRFTPWQVSKLRFAFNLVKHRCR